MKTLLIIFTLAMLAGVSYYLWFMESDIKANFEVKTHPGTVIQALKGWTGASTSIRLISADWTAQPIRQQVTVNDRDYIYQWTFRLLNDSVTKVQVGVREPDRSLANRISIPFFATAIEHDTQSEVSRFYMGLREHLSQIKVRVDGLSRIDSVFSVCIAVRGNQAGKAMGMMANYALLSGFVAANDLQTAGMPFVEITDWNMSEDKLHYNFCYPIRQPAVLPAHPELTYKWLKATEAVKATYQGNYTTSDRAWYALQHYARRNNLTLSELPIEFFYHNPNMDADESKWKAEVFFPIVGR